MKIVLTPESLNSTAAVIADGPLGPLYVQCLDAYGFQREMSVKFTEKDATVSVYVHPGRRESQTVPLAEGKRFVADFVAYVEKYPAALFNGSAENAPRCAGFVRLQERLFCGEPLKWAF